MSGRSKPVIIGIAAFVVFIGLGLILDRGALLFLLEGPEKMLNREKNGIISAIRKYNAIIADLYATDGVPKMLNEIPATKAIRHDIFRDIGFIRDSDRVLIYDMAKMTPVEVILTGPATAEAVIFEEWNYIYQRKEDRAAVSRVRGTGLGFKYRLQKEKGQWIVYEFAPAAVEDPQLTGTLPVK